MAMTKFAVTLVGTRPLLLHNAQLADPTNQWSQELARLTKVRQKTLEQHLEIRRVEWFGGLYLDDDDNPAIPGENITAMLVQAARKFKRGKQFAAGVVEAEPWFAIIHDGPKTLKEMYALPPYSDYRSVVISQRRVMRCRPRFLPWKLPVSLLYDSQAIEEIDLNNAFTIAGESIGLGDRRPQFGRFTVE